MAIVFVRTVIAHCKLGLIPVTRGSHQWCQGPSDSGTVLPCEGTLVLIPNDFNAVPIIMVPRCMEVMVDLKETRNTIDKLLCAEVVTAGRGGTDLGPIFRSTLLRDKMNCKVGFVNCFLQVPLACLGSMAQGSRAGISVEL